MSYRECLCSLLLLLVAAPAFAATHQKTGLSITPPAPFVTVVLEDHPAAVAAVIAITLPGEAPETAEGENFNCALAYRLAPSNNALAQADINATMARAEAMNRIKASFAPEFELGEPSLFAADGVFGLEFIGTSRTGPAQVLSAVYMTTMQTPGGITNLTCVSSPARLDGLLTPYRKIRNEIKPGR